MWASTSALSQAVVRPPRPRAARARAARRRPGRRAPAGQRRPGSRGTAPDRAGRSPTQRAAEHQVEQRRRQSRGHRSPSTSERRARRATARRRAADWVESRLSRRTSVSAAGSTRRRSARPLGSARSTTASAGDRRRAAAPTHRRADQATGSPGHRGVGGAARRAGGDPSTVTMRTCEVPRSSAASTASAGRRAPADVADPQRRRRRRAGSARPGDTAAHPAAGVALDPADHQAVAPVRVQPRRPAGCRRGTPRTRGRRSPVMPGARDRHGPAARATTREPPRRQRVRSTQPEPAGRGPRPAAAGRRRRCTTVRTSPASRSAGTGPWRDQHAGPSSVTARDLLARAGRPRSTRSPSRRDAERPGDRGAAPRPSPATSRPSRSAEQRGDGPGIPVGSYSAPWSTASVARPRPGRSSGWPPIGDPQRARRPAPGAGSRRAGRASGRWSASSAGRARRRCSGDLGDPVAGRPAPRGRRASVPGGTKRALDPAQAPAGGPCSRPSTRAVGSWSPRGTKTGSGTRIWPVGSKK